MLNRMDVIAPPNRAPQEMQDSMMIAEVGGIVKVRGNKMAMPLAPPSPGNTPITTPSTMPIIINKKLNGVRTTAKPLNNALSSTNLTPATTSSGVSYASVNNQGSAA